MAEEVDYQEQAEGYSEGIDELDRITDDLGLDVEDQVPIHADVVCLIYKVVSRH